MYLNLAIGMLLAFALNIYFVRTDHECALPWKRWLEVQTVVLFGFVITDIVLKLISK